MFDNSEDSVESLISLTILLESLGPGHWGTDHRRLIIDTQIISKCFKKIQILSHSFKILFCYNDRVSQNDKIQIQNKFIN